MPPKQARRRGTGRGRGGTAVSRARASLPARIDPAPPAVCARARGLRTRRPEFALFPLITCGESARQRDREKETESERKGERNSHVWSRRSGAQEPWREATPGRDSRVRRGRDAHAMGVHSCMPLRACRRKNRKVGAPLTRAGCLSLGQRRLRVFASEGARARASARGPGTGVRGVGRGCRRRAGRSACVSEWQEPA